MVVATEELSRGSLGAGGSLITRPEILTRALEAGGTEEQKQEWLPKLATAEVMNAVAVTEPDFGSDVAGVKVTATPTEGGWLLNGVKTWCTFGARADVLMVLARTDPDRSLGHRGLSMFIVPKERGDGHGFELTQENASGGGKMEGRPIDTIGYRGMHSYEVALENWFVPAENLIGGEAAKAAASTTRWPASRTAVCRPQPARSASCRPPTRQPASTPTTGWCSARTSPSTS
jgi:(2S)-methylsuccinyl-CoA dehydrogenase